MKFFGSDATPGSIQVAISRHVYPMVKLVKDHANSGGDCKDLNLLADAKTGKGQIFALYTLHILLVFCPAFFH